MNQSIRTLSLSTLLVAAAFGTIQPAAAVAVAPAPVAIASDPAAKELERKAREALGDAVEKRASEVAERVRGQLGDRAVDEDPAGAGADELATPPDPVLARLAAIEERLCAIEGLLAEMCARQTGAPPANATQPNVTAPQAVAAVLVTPATPATPVTPVTNGFAQARIRTWHNGKEATIKITVNGVPAGRFDTNTCFDLAPFLVPERMNQVAFQVEPRGKGDASGIELHVDAQMPGGSSYVSILQFEATKERLADTLDVPWAPR